jgi:hypothetical protein
MIFTLCCPKTNWVINCGLKQFWWNAACSQCMWLLQCQVVYWQITVFMFVVRGTVRYVTMLTTVCWRCRQRKLFTHLYDQLFLCQVWMDYWC